MDLFFQGLIIGLAISIPVGPIGVLCIQRTLNQGRLSGLITGMGAATADAFYGAVAGFGLVTVSNFLIEQQVILKNIGGLFLIYLGIKSFLSKPAMINEDTANKNIFSDYFSTMFLTFTNPMTILSFLAVFAGIGFASESRSYFSATLLVAGVFLGSALWWLILSTGTSFLRHRIDNKTLIWVNRISGAFIFLIAVFILLS